MAKGARVKTAVQQIRSLKYRLARARKQGWWVKAAHYQRTLDVLEASRPCPEGRDGWPANGDAA